MMIRSYRFLFVFAILTFVVSCKNDTKELHDETNNTSEIEDLEKIKPTQEDMDRVNSVMARLMATPESKTFSSYMVSAQITDTLMQQQGPFTVFAPGNEAFENLKEETQKDLLREAKRPALAALLNKHIVSGSYNTVSLVQKIKENNGKFVLTTLSGVALTATKKGNDLVITSPEGTSGIIGKSDITGSNGVVHILSSVLTGN
jgi:uncharacterized surface protein with fasciclin (FAS1) repeats